MYKQDSASDNLQGLIYHQIKSKWSNDYVIILGKWIQRSKFESTVFGEKQDYSNTAISILTRTGLNCFN